mgnify:CR=1 FL=1
MIYPVYRYLPMFLCEQWVLGMTTEAPSLPTKQAAAVEQGQPIRMDRWIRWMDFGRAALVFL